MAGVRVSEYGKEDGGSEEDGAAAVPYIVGKHNGRKAMHDEAIVHFEQPRLCYLHLVKGQDRCVLRKRGRDHTDCVSLLAARDLRYCRTVTEDTLSRNCLLSRILLSTDWTDVWKWIGRAKLGLQCDQRNWWYSDRLWIKAWYVIRMESISSNNVRPNYGLILVLYLMDVRSEPQIVRKLHLARRTSTAA